MPYEVIHTAVMVVPMHYRSGDVTKLEFEGVNYDVVIPPGVKVGERFEAELRRPREFQNLGHIGTIGGLDGVVGIHDDPEEEGEENKDKPLKEIEVRRPHSVDTMHKLEQLASGETDFPEVTWHNMAGGYTVAARAAALEGRRRGARCNSLRRTLAAWAEGRGHRPGE